ncbi:hypothetical protein ABZ070_33600 [Streptomyces sp. NPDC006283]|uniref:hypothetical protein n=1 Tax=Streptomyces sp. NPDC006283 TaxID=3156741 RepID=UPI0033B1E1FC
MAADSPVAQPSTTSSAGTSVQYAGKTSGAFNVNNVGRRVADPRNTLFIHHAANPVISGSNLYGANPVKADGRWNVYFGGWLSQTTYDEIHLATSLDDTLASGYSDIKTIIGHGVYAHVNDPSAVKREFGWVMAMTTATSVAADDHCSILTSPDGVNWPQLNDRSHEVNFIGASVPRCARPSLIWNANHKNGTGRWEMYFDASVNGGPHGQHLAVSSESVPKNFTYVARVGDFVDADIRLLNGQYIAAYRPTWVSDPVWRIHSATSTDGVRFADHGAMLGTHALQPFDDCGVTNPGWAINEKGLITSLMYGGTASCNYNAHKLGVAVPQAAATLYSGSVALVHRLALTATAQHIDTHEYTAVDRIQITDRPGASPRIDQPIAGTRGDAWSIVTP